MASSADKEDLKTRQDKADVARTRGNELFKSGDYPSALAAYTEAIKHNPDDPKPYSNRAACYNKLAALDLGVKDCDACIKLDPKFIKGYVRKGVLLKSMEKYDRAMQAFQKAIELDENNAEAIKGYRECMMSIDNDPAAVSRRALADPEVRAIIDDDDFRVTLGKMGENNDEAIKHLQRPWVSRNFQKMVQSGLVTFVCEEPRPRATPEGATKPDPA